MPPIMKTSKSMAGQNEDSQASQIPTNNLEGILSGAQNEVGSASGIKAETRLIPLREDNFVTWKWHTKMVLEDKDLWSSVEGTCSDEAKNRTAKQFLAGIISEQNQQRVVNCTTAAQIWNTLESTFENKSATERTMLMEKFMSYRIRSLRDIGKSFAEIQSLAARLISLGAAVNDETIINVILKGLPDELKTWKSTWRMINAENPNLNALISGINAEIAGMKIPENSAMIATEKTWTKRLGNRNFRNNQNNSWNQRSNGGQRGKQANACHYCGISGHWIRDCRKKQADEGKRNPQSSQSKGVAMMALEKGEKYGPERWLADSGCSFHMTAKSEWIQDYSQFDIPKSITLGDDRNIPAIGSGFIQTSFGKLLDVHYVPELSTSLFSVAAATNNGVEIHFNKETVLLMKNGVAVCSGWRQDGIYILNFGIQGQNGSAFKAMSLDNWHKRFGHVSKDAIKKMAELKVVDGLEIENRDVAPTQCESCVLGKCKNASHQLKTSPKVIEAGSSLHLDTIGPFKQESLGGAKYLLLCKDEASSYKIGKPVLTKSVIGNEVKLIISQAELETGNRVKRIVTDNGTEFVNKDLKSFLDEQGIIHKTSTRYTPQQNGLIERENRTIIESAITLLNDTSLRRELWAEAVNVAIYVLNRSINANNQQTTPYELWFGRKPNVKNLHRFGQNAIVKYRDFQRSKWDEKGVRQVFVGYTDTFNTFRFYDPGTDAVYQSCDVTFLDDPEPSDSESETSEQIIQVEIGNDQNDNRDDSHSINLEQTIDFDSMHWDHDIDIYGQQMQTDNTFVVQGLILPSTSTPQRENVQQENEPTSSKEYKSSTTEQIQTNNHNNNNRTVTFHVDSEDEGAPLSRPVDKVKRSRLDRIKELGEIKKPSDIHKGHIIPPYLKRLQKPRHEEPDSPTKRSFFAKIATLEAQEDPKSYSEAMTRSDKDQWKKAMNEEIESLKKNQVYTLVDRPRGNIVTNKWVFKIKRDPQGKIERYKARLVARGFTQSYGVDYLETYAPVANMVSIRMIFAFAAMAHLEMAQFDIKTAFLYGDLDAEVYMEQPEGFIENQNQVCLLKRSLYGLKQSPRQWNLKFSNFLKEMNLTASEHDPCVFYCKKPLLIMAIYVDDGIIFAEDKDSIRRIIEQLKSRFEVHTMESNTFLGFQVYKGTKGDISLHQTSYINTILKRFNMEDSKQVGNPSTLTITSGDSEPLMPHVPYREAIGSLMYAAVTTRMDIAFAVSKASRHVENPTNEDWVAVKRIFRYLRGTNNYALTYSSPLKRELIVFCDADFAGDPKTSRSTTGSVFIYGGAPIHWKSQRQSLITLSSTEAEFVSLCSTVKETIWIRKFGLELGFLDEKPTSILCDNQSAIKIASNEKCCHRTRHMSVQAAYPREQMEKGRIEIEHVKSNEQLADMLTKPLTELRFTNNRNKLMNLLIACIQTLMLICILCATPIIGKKEPQNLLIRAERSTMELQTDMTQIEYTYKFSYVNPCPEIGVSPIEKQEWSDFKYHMRSDCRNVFTNTWEIAVKNALSCTPSLLQAMRTRRNIPAGLAFSILKKVATAGTNFLVSRTLPNLLARKEIIDSTYRETDFKRLFDTTSRDYVDMTSETAMYHQMKTQKWASELSRTLWVAMRIHTEILSNTANLDVITESCQNGRLAPKELAELLGDPTLYRLNSEKGYIKSIKRDSEHAATLLIEFVAYEEAEKLTTLSTTPSGTLPRILGSSTSAIVLAEQSKVTLPTIITYDERGNRTLQDGPVNVTTYIIIAIILFAITLLTMIHLVSRYLLLSHNNPQDHHQYTRQRRYITNRDVNRQSRLVVYAAPSQSTEVYSDISQSHQELREPIERTRRPSLQEPTNAISNR